MDYVTTHIGCGQSMFPVSAVARRGRQIATVLTAVALVLLMGCLSTTATFSAPSGPYARISAPDRQWEDEIFYLIVPTKFLNGDTENDVMLRRFGGNPYYKNGYRGGDLAGIIQKLDYLADLGVTTLFLYPIQQNDQGPLVQWLARGYRVKDYFAVDENLGDLETAKDLVAKAHARGMRVILDMPLSLCGHENPLNSQEYRDRGWFTGERSWGMPIWNADNPETGDYLISVGEFWRDEVGFDGFRMDSAEHLSTAFWLRFASAMRDESHPEFFLLGEVLGGTGKIAAFLKESSFDSVYDWGMLSTQRVFGGSRDLSMIDFVQHHGHKDYPNPRRMVAEIDNYEDPTFIGKTQEPKIERMRMALAFLLTIDRIPLLYTGNEAALAYSDVGALFATENKKPEFFEYVKRLIAVRKQEAALRRGTYERVYYQEPVMAYTRTLDGDQALVILNRSDSEQAVSFPVGDATWDRLGLVDLLTGQTAKASGELTPLALKRFSAAVLKVTRPQY